MWKGTAATLNPSPAMISTSPRNIARSKSLVSADSAAAISLNRVDPLTP